MQGHTCNTMVQTSALYALILLTAPAVVSAHTHAAQQAITALLVLVALQHAQLVNTTQMKARRRKLLDVYHARLAATVQRP